jgi:type IV secretory pathway TraG/TraD family ATPase VirD4
LYDEFGHSTIPNFVSTANTVRAYRVSLSIILQSISQLEARYGKIYAKSIQGGFSTYITYSGSDPETVLLFERLAGRVRERQRKELDDIVDTYKEYNLMNAGEVRTIASDQLLLVSTNNNPVLLHSKGFYELRKYLRMTQKGAFPVQGSTKQPSKYIKL